MVREHRHEVSEHCPVIHDFNLTRHFITQKGSTVKEHMQNWRDEMVRHTGEYLESPAEERRFNEDPFSKIEMKMSEEGEGEGEGDDGNGNDRRWLFYFRQENGSVHQLGWLVVAKREGPAGPRLELIFCNHNVALDKRIFKLGNSSKVNSETGEDLPSSNLAGRFGTGVKYEILDLMNSNASVTYVTAGNEWIFRFSDDTANVFECEDNIPMEVAEEQDNTYMILENVNPSAFDVSHYLFLLPNSIDDYDVRSATQRLEILDKPGGTVHNNVYAHGIFICKFSDDHMSSREAPIKFGLNYCGGFEGLGYSHVRTQIDKSKLSGMMYHLLDKYDSSDARFWKVRKILYDLLNHGATHRALYPSFRADKDFGFPIFFEAMVDEFMYRVDYDQFTIPYSDEWSAMNPSEKSDCKVLDITRVRVSNVLLEHLKESPNCPNFKQHKDANTDYYLQSKEIILRGDAMPPYEMRPQDISVDDDENESIHHQRCRSLREIVKSLQNIGLETSTVRFKLFQDPNKKRENRITDVTVKIDENNERCFLLYNLEAVNMEAIHENLQCPRSGHSPLSGPPCRCFEETALIDLVFYIRKAGDGNLEEKFNRNLRIAYVNAAVGGKTIHRSEAEIRAEERANANMTDEEEDTDGSLANYLGTESLYSIVRSAEREPDPESFFNDLRETSQMCREISETESFRNGSGDRGNEGNTSEMGPTNLLKYCEVVQLPGKSHSFDDMTDINGIFCPRNEVGSIDKYIIAEHDSRNEYKTRQQAINSFHYVVEIMASVFQVPIERFHLFYTRKRATIAFNRGPGEIFFNIVYLQYSFKNDMHWRKKMYFWYVTTCHELAHNKAPGHDAFHGDVMEKLIVHHFPKLVKELDSFQERNKTHK